MMTKHNLTPEQALDIIDGTISCPKCGHSDSLSYVASHKVQSHRTVDHVENGVIYVSYEERRHAILENDIDVRLYCEHLMSVDGRWTEHPFRVCGTEFPIPDGFAVGEA